METRPYAQVAFRPNAGQSWFLKSTTRLAGCGGRLDAGTTLLRRFIIASMIALLAGCALAPPPDGQVLLSEALPPTTAIPAEWSTEGVAPSAVKDNWVASFDDPQLASLVAEAIENNRDLVAAAARVEAALRSVDIAGAPLLPWIGLGAGSQASRNFDSNSTNELAGAELAISWELDLWGKLRSGEAAAAASAVAAADLVARARQSIAATVARGWIDYTEIALLTAATNEVIRDYARLVRLAEEKEAAGQVSEFDVVQARGRLNAARATLVEVEARANSAAAVLEVLLGRYPSLTLQPNLKYPPIPDALSTGLPLSLLDRRPDVTAARNEVIASFYDVQVAKLARLPGISLAVAAGTLLDPDLAVLGTNLNFFRVGASLLQPIFQGGALQAQFEQATASQQAATAAYGQVVLTALGEVEAYLANESLLRKGLESWQRSYVDARRAVQLGLDNYVAGSIDMVAILDLVEFAIQRRIDVIESESGLLKNRVSIYLSLGENY